MPPPWQLPRGPAALSPAPSRSAPAEGGLSSCLPAGGAERRAVALQRDLEAPACPGPHLLGARERRLFPGPRLLRGRGHPRCFFRSLPRPPSPRRQALFDRAGHLPCGAGCRHVQAAWPGRALPPHRRWPVPRRFPPTPGKRPPVGDRGKWRPPRPQQLPLLAAGARPGRERGCGQGSGPSSGPGPAAEGTRSLPRSGTGEPLAGASGALARVPSESLNDQGVKNCC